MWGEGAPRQAFPDGALVVIHKWLKPDRGREGSRLPSLRTVRAVFPHTALQSAVSSSGVSLGKPGRVKREQPGPREEGIVPAFVVVKAAAHAGPLFSFP